MFEFTPSILLLYSPSHIPGTVSTGLIFPFSYMSTKYFHHIHSYTLSLYPPLSHWCQPPDRTRFAFLSSVFEKRHFCLRLLYREFHCDISM
jgi:hypothetical protein